MIFEKALTAPVGGANGQQVIAASGAWTAPDQYAARVCFYETPYCLTLSLRFKEDRLVLDLEYNVAFGPKKWQLVGSVAPAR